MIKDVQEAAPGAAHVSGGRGLHAALS